MVLDWKWSTSLLSVHWQISVLQSHLRARETVKDSVNVHPDQREPKVRSVARNFCQMGSMEHQSYVLLTLSAFCLGISFMQTDTAPYVKLILVTFQFFKIILPVLACMLHCDLMCHSSLGTSSDEYNYIILSINITSSYSYHGCIGNMMNAMAMFLESSVGSGPDFHLPSFVCLDMCL